MDGRTRDVEQLRRTRDSLIKCASGVGLSQSARARSWKSEDIEASREGASMRLDGKSMMGCSGESGW